MLDAFSEENACFLYLEFTGWMVMKGSGVKRSLTQFSNNIDAATVVNLLHFFLLDSLLRHLLKDIVTLTGLILTCIKQTFTDILFVRLH